MALGVKTLAAKTDNPSLISGSYMGEGENTFQQAVLYQWHMHTHMHINVNKCNL